MESQNEWVRESMRQFGDQLSDIRRDVGDVRERMIKLEASTLHDTVADLRAQLTMAMARVDALESARDQQAGQTKGVASTADWLYKIAPWIFATALVVATNLPKLTGG